MLFKTVLAKKLDLPLDWPRMIFQASKGGFPSVFSSSSVTVGRSFIHSGVVSRSSSGWES